MIDQLMNGPTLGPILARLRLNCKTNRSLQLFERRHKVLRAQFQHATLRCGRNSPGASPPFATDAAAEHGSPWVRLVFVFSLVASSNVFSKALVSEPGFSELACGN